MNGVGIARRLLVGCAIGCVVVVTWALTERVKSRLPPEKPALDADAPKVSPVTPLPTGGANYSRPQPESGAESSMREASAREVGAPVTFHLDEPARSTPYEIMMSTMGSQSATLVLSERHKILSSEDDPEWARPMEKELFAYVMEVAESDSTVVESITCRSAGCEMQLSHDLESKAAARVMLGLRDRFPSLQFSLDKPGLVGDRVLQLTYLARLNQNAAQEPIK